MKIKTPLFFIVALLFVSTVINSCKKDSQSTFVQSLFSNGSWQLASVQVFHFLGSSNISTDTLNTMCDSTQLFTFNTDHSCTYTNFDCLAQTKAVGTWTTSTDQLFLMADITCVDTIPGNKISSGKPFIYTKIVNLGQYSMILQTGDINTFYTANTKRTIMQYGFVRVTTTGN